MRRESFEFFSREFDLHTLSHRGLNQELIPQWLASGEQDLDGRIVSSAYGETPWLIQDRLTELLELVPPDVFLDVGAGGGGVLVRVLSQGISAFGIEQNRFLVEAGRKHLKSLNLQPECLARGDFLACPWPQATKVYAATSRFSDETLKGLARRIQETESIQRVVTLGRELDLYSNWTMNHRFQQPVRWNEGEAKIPEILCSWVKCEGVPPNFPLLSQ